MNLHMSFDFGFSDIICTSIMRFLFGSEKNVCCNLQGQKLQACDLPVNSWQVELYVKVLTLGPGR